MHFLNQTRSFGNNFSAVRAANSMNTRTARDGCLFPACGSQRSNVRSRHFGTTSTQPTPPTTRLRRSPSGRWSSRTYACTFLAATISREKRRCGLRGISTPRLRQDGPVSKSANGSRSWKSHAPTNYWTVTTETVVQWRSWKTPLY
jgi:hypothetical protein